MARAPFSSTGTYTGSELVKPAVTQLLTEGVFKNNELLGQFPAPILSPGDTAFRWPIHTAPNASVGTFSEGDAAPEPDSQEYVKGAVSYVYFWGALQVTGHARDAMRSNYLPGISLEGPMLEQDLMDLVNTTWMDSSVGLQVAVDSSSSYAGITRSGASYFQSLETAVSDIVGFGDMIDELEGLRDNDRGARPNKILAPWNQVTRIYQIIDQPGVKQIGPADAAAGYTGLTFAGLPVVGMPDLTDSVILFLDTSRFSNVIHRAMSADDMPKTGDPKSSIVMVTFAMALVCRDPLRQGKLTGCTA